MIAYQSIRFQRGVATLLVSLLILTGATLIVFFTANTSLMEQRISGNEIRTKQAANAAQAGLEQALSYLIAGGANLREPAFTANLDDGSTYVAVFWNNIAATSPPTPPTPPTMTNNRCPDAPGTPIGYIQPSTEARMGIAPFTNIIIYSCGWSDDRAAIQPVTVVVRAVPPPPMQAPAPLITRGVVNTNGAARVFNHFTNLTIWTGDNLDITGNPGNTFLRADGSPSPDIQNPKPSNPASCNNSGVHFKCTTRATEIASDVLHRDNALSSLSPDEFFQTFIGESKEDFEASARMRVLGTNPSSLNNLTRTTIWVEGNANLSGQIGTRDNPVILVINGNADVAGNFEFYGVLYVINDMSSSGTPDFYGTTIVEGSTTASGNPNYIFDPLALQNIAPLGPKVAVAGSWRDWLNP